MVVAGTLELGNAQAAGTGIITFVADQALLRVKGATVPTNTIAGFTPRETIDLANIALTPMLAPVTGNGQIALPIAAGGTVSLGVASLPAHSAVQTQSDGAGGSTVTLLTAVVVQQGTGSLLVPLGNSAYADIAQTLATANTASTQTAGARLVGIGAAPVLAAATLTGAATDGGLVLSGTEDLHFTAGAGAGTVIAGGGNDRYDILGGAGNQVLLLGTGADTVYALAGNDTIDGNDGGKLILLGSGDDLVISHTLTAVDSVFGGTGSATIRSTGNLIASGFSTPLQLQADAGVTTLFGGTGAATVTGHGNLVATTDSTLNALLSVGGNFILGGAATTAITFTGYHDGAILNPDTVSGGAGKVSVVDDNGGLFLAGTAGGNFVDLLGGASTVVGGGDGDVVKLTNVANASIFLAGASTVDGSSGLGDATIVAGGGASSIATGGGHAMIWLGAGNATVNAYGADTIVGGAGAATVTAGLQGVLAFAGAGPMSFANGSAASTVVGGSTALTVTGGSGGGVFLGSTAGGNQLTAGTGATTLVGAGAGDVLTLANPANNLVVGGAGAETLGGAAATGTNALYAGTGPDVMIAGGGTTFLLPGPGDDLMIQGTGLTQYDFIAGRSGGHDTISGWNPASAAVGLYGYDIPTTLATAVTTGGNTTLTLADGTQITFLATTSLSPSSFF